MENSAIRDQHGLLRKCEYSFNDDGSINWRRMIPQKHFVINAEKTDEKDIKKVADNELLILLQGFKDVARIRGYRSVKYPQISSGPTYCTVTCEISWIGNIETDMRYIISAGVGDATLENTNGFGKMFLGPIAENRAFIRAVKAGLNIEILGAEELRQYRSTAGLPVETEVVKLYIDQLNDVMKEKNVTWDRIKSRLERENFPGADKMTSVSDIPGPKILELIEKIKGLRNR